MIYLAWDGIDTASRRAREGGVCASLLVSCRAPESVVFVRFSGRRVAMSQQKQSVSEVDEAIEHLRQALETIRYGSVEFIIHDGRVLQIDRKEKVRFEVASGKHGYGGQNK